MSRPQPSRRRLELDAGSGVLWISFPYDSDLLAVIRRLPGRTWHPSSRRWFVAAEHADDVARRLEPYGFRFDGDAAATTTEGSSDSAGSVDSAKSGESAPSPAAGRPGAATVSDEAEPEVPALSVLELNESVRRALSAAFPAPVWVVGEIVGSGRTRQSRHLFFQLADRGADSDKPSAVVDAVIWERQRERVLAPLRAAGVEIRDGLRVRVRGVVDLYPPSGRYSFQVDAIDASFTEGDIARRRERVLQEIEQLGIREDNRRKPFPVPCLRIGLITSDGSDAYNDVISELKRSEFAFEVDVYGVRVQGDRAETQIVEALDHFAVRADQYDCVLIVRGGGAKTELMAFDSRAIGVAIAEHPLKVIAGIGHERDITVADQIAHREKTPTAVGRLLVELAETELRKIESAGERIAARASRIVDDERRTLENARRLLRSELLRRLANQRAAFSTLHERIRDAARSRLERERSGLERRTVLAAVESKSRLRSARSDLGATGERLRAAMLRRVERQRDALEARTERVRERDPARLLERGYAWVVDDAGRSIRRAADLPAGREFELRVSDGRVRAESKGELPDRQN